MIEGLNYDMPEALFWRGLAGSGLQSINAVTSGSCGIKLNYKKHVDKDGPTRWVSNGTVFLTFVPEWLAMLFKEADFDGHLGGDLQQWTRSACTLVQLANAEMNKLPSHVRARRGLDYGCLRYDGDVCKFQEPSTERAKEFDPKWIKLDLEMSEAGVYYLDEWQERQGRH